MKNKRVKQMISDVAMQGRKLFWYGETSEVFVAKSAEDIYDEYLESCDDPEDFACEVITTNWQTMWCKVTSETSIGGSIASEDGYHRVPLISFIRKHDDENPAPQLTTGYN